MAISTASKLIDRIRRAAYPPDAAGVTDEQLLASFHDRHDQTAFAALVRRHGPMVMGVCRRVLGHTHDAEDAFQVTFLVLARKATAIGQPQLLGNWLYGVALRTAQDARKLAVRRRVHEKQVHTMPDPSVEPEANCRESQQYLDLELGRLADKYRVPVVLCELQGRSRKEVASLLGVPEGTVSSRLATARKVLAGRLAARGVVLSAGALTTALPAQTAGAAVPAALIQTTVQAAMALTAGPTAATALLSAELTSLLEGVLRTMALTQLKKAATVLLLAAAMFAGGAGLVSHRVLADKPAPTEPNAASPAENQAEPQATTVTGKFVSFKEGLLTIKLVGPEAKETAWKVAGDTRTVLVIANIAKEGTAQNTLTRIEPGAIVAVTIQDGKATHIQVGTSEAAAPGRDEPKPRSGSGRFLTFKNGALKVENPAGILVWNKLPENARVFEYRDDASGYQAAGAEQALRQVKVGTWVHVNADKREIHIGAKKTFVTGTFVSFKNGTLLLLGRPEEIGPSFAKKYGNNLSFSKLPENIPVFASIDGGDYQPSGTVATAFKDVKEGAVVRVHAEGEGNLTVIQIGVPKKQ